MLVSDSLIVGILDISTMNFLVGVVRMLGQVHDPLMIRVLLAVSHYDTLPILLTMSHYNTPLIMGLMPHNHIVILLTSSLLVLLPNAEQPIVPLLSTTLHHHACVIFGIRMVRVPPFMGHDPCCHL
jgi:hypothetical protein